MYGGNEDVGEWKRARAYVCMYGDVWAVEM